MTECKMLFLESFAVFLDNYSCGGVPLKSGGMVRDL